MTTTTATLQRLADALAAAGIQWTPSMDRLHPQDQQEAAQALLDQALECTGMPGRATRIALHRGFRRQLLDALEARSLETR